ncbi:hypothetical protein [uncultured Kordia sp.]|uniref:hypothetical protein n=1 Tax=uncultured Kordia sp. TaxID=507699 RepID=UPI00262EF7D3|nr:hypothetical protein [uncultured Kordia sp.]
MIRYFRISKWLLIIGGIIYISLVLFSIITVGSAGHNTGINIVTVFACLLMILFLLLTHKFENFGNKVFEILNWLTIGLIIWVMSNVIYGSLTDYNKGEELLLISSIALPMILASIVVIGLMKKLNKRIT